MWESKQVVRVEIATSGISRQKWPIPIKPTFPFLFHTRVLKPAYFPRRNLIPRKPRIPHNNPPSSTMSCPMLDLSEIYATACERHEQEVEEALKEVEALHLSLCAAQQRFPTADLAAKPALWSQMDADVDLALKTFKAIKVHFLTLDGITTTIFNPPRVHLDFRPRNFGHLHKSAWDSLCAFRAIRDNMVALFSEEEADAKRNMEEKLLHLGQVFNDQGLEPDKQVLEDLEWQISRAETLFIVKFFRCILALFHAGMLVYLLVTGGKG